MAHRKPSASVSPSILLVLTTLMCLLAFGERTFPVAAQKPEPDLTIDGQVMRDTLDFVTRTFKPSDCAVIEGCVPTTGTRRLMRFNVLTPNIGDVDLVLGDPSLNPEFFEYSPCHRHYHFSGYAEYALLMNNMERTLVITGRKQAFCLLDSLPYTDDAGRSSGYNCRFQGITAGWADLYRKTLDCQWLDVTGVPPGNYLLRVTINPEHRLVESDDTNNVAIVPVTIR